MKVRDGFVSNSSSTSYLIIATKEAWEEAKQKVRGLGAKIGKTIQQANSAQIGTQKVVMFSYVTGNDNDGQLDSVFRKCGYGAKFGKDKDEAEIDWKKYDEAYKAWEEFKQALRDCEKKGDVIMKEFYF